jgi:uncharacterized repeat protein (TIGR01451 family)
MIKSLNTYLKVFLLLITIACYTKVEAQISNFTISDPNPINHPVGSSFPLSVQLVWPTGVTGSATAVINYNGSLLNFDASNLGSLPSCLNITNSGSAITINILNLSNCQNTGTFGFSLNFVFKCTSADTCAGPTSIKQAIFNGSLINNVINGIPTNITPSLTVSSILNNAFSFSQHQWVSYNSQLGEITFKVSYNNPNCFIIKNPVFNVALTPTTLGGTIVRAFGFNSISYTVGATGLTITPSLTSFSQNSDVLYYVVKLNCGVGLGQQITSNINLIGKNCTTPNSLLATASPISYNIPLSTPTAIPNIVITPNAATSTQFSYRIKNSGNTVVNFTVTNFIPAVHVVSVGQSSSDQTDLVGTVKYYDCNTTPSSVYTLNGNATNSNASAPNTAKYEHTIMNLLPGKTVTVSTNYNLTSSCVVGTAPYKDSISVEYNCVAPIPSCIPCGPNGIINTISVYNIQPIISCHNTSTLISTNPGFCSNLGDTFTICYQFKNTGTAPLIGGRYNVQLPIGIQALANTDSYSGFLTNSLTNPTIVSSTNLSFNLPDLPVSATNVYGICFRAIVQSGAVGGLNQYFWAGVSTATGYYNNPNICYVYYSICSYSGFGISKKVKGSANTTFANTGQGAPGSNVEYEITLNNTGTVPISNIEVIDRIPAQNNLTILGPVSTVIPNAFNMEMIAAPINSNYSVSYTNTQNICTLWPGSGTPCNSGLWSGTLANGGVKFLFNPTFTIIPGGSSTFTFQTKIPSNAANNQIDCNKIGMSAIPSGMSATHTESGSACITVINPCPPVTPAFTTIQTCANDVFNVTATSTFTGTANHQWSLMQASSCGSTSDVGTGITIGAVQTTPNALFSITNFNLCYYIKHRIFSTTGCVFDTTYKTAVNLPTSSLFLTSNLEDSNGVVKDNFCVGENVYLDGTASTGETQYTIQIFRKPAGSISSFAPYVTFTAFTGSAGIINLTQLLLGLSTPRYFEPQYEYSVTFTISNPGTCTASKSTKLPFKIYCCDGYINANFQLSVVPTVGSYTLSPVIFNSYAAANPTHEWYILSSPNSGAGPYTPEFSTTAATFSFPNAQYNLYYSVIHKIKTKCGEECIGREQYQSSSKSTEAVFVDCCLATQFWANGAGTEPQLLSAEFEIGTTPLGGGQYTINIFPTNNYSSNPTITHEWFVLSSPNTGGGPYTAVAHSTAFNYNFSPANDGLYYFIIHKVKSPCGEVCYGQSTCRNCGGTCSEKCEMCGVIDCKILDEVWPACYPPINLVNNCRRDILSWDVVPSANSYEVELDYNDPNCCKSLYDQVTTIYGAHLNSLNLNEFDHPKFNCIRWRVRANCERGVVGEWSEWSCYYCEEIILIDPLKSKSNTNINFNPAIDAEPKVSPNPNNGEMNLQMQTKGELTLSIDVFNTQGILVKSIPQNKYADGKFFTRLNMGANTAKGLYLVVFKTNVGTFNKKVIIN